MMTRKIFSIIVFIFALSLTFAENIETIEETSIEEINSEDVPTLDNEESPEIKESDENIESIEEDLYQDEVLLKTLEAIEEKNIIRLPDKKIRKIKDIIHYAEKCGKNINNFETQKWISNSFDYSMEEITKLLSWYSCSNVKSEYESFEDRTEVSIFDITDVCKKTGYKSTEELYLLKEIFQKNL